MTRPKLSLAQQAVVDAMRDVVEASVYLRKMNFYGFASVDDMLSSVAELEEALRLAPEWRVDSQGDTEI